MNLNRAEVLHKNFIDRVSSGQLPDLLNTTPLGLHDLLSDTEIGELFESQITSRLLDIISRRLSSQKQSFYTIGSSGHEGNAAFGKAFALNDPAFLHYRSCPFVIQRSKQLSGQTPIYDTLLSFCASREDPVSGGRHKVLGSKALWIPPQTSTIASHLPKAVGAAHALGLYKKVAHEDVGLSHDNIVICCFGDASSNHSTAQGAINAAVWAAYQHSPMPIVFICEDNGIGISTPTPKGWIQQNFSHRPGLKYMRCNGLDLLDTYSTAQAAGAYAREYKKPVFLHMQTIRLMGHANSDVERVYRSQSEINATEDHDPLLYTAALLAHKNILSTHDILALYQLTEQRLSRVAKIATQRPKLQDATDIMQSIWPTPHDQVLDNNAKTLDKNLPITEQSATHKKQLPMVKHINHALADLMTEHSNIVLLGQDIAAKGGVYGVTQGLLKKFGPARVTNTLLDEQSMLGAAIGLAQCGFVPIVEIQYLAYLHNAEDQIRGEAASLSFFSNTAFTNPMVIRVAGLAYQKGFGGHFHNDNGIGVFRDIPGIILVTASNGADAAGILRACLHLAINEKRVVIFLEPIALYSMRDLHQPGDNLWALPYQGGNTNSIPYGAIKTHGNGNTLCILTYANGFYLSCQAEKILREQYNIDLRIVDIRWLHPLPEHALVKAVTHCEHILVVDECRKSGSISEAIFTLLIEAQCPASMSRVTGEDSFIPLGDAAHFVLPDVNAIVRHALKLIHGHHQVNGAITHTTNLKNLSTGP